MTIQTQRCTIRDFEPGDIPRFMEYRNDAHWMRYQGYKGKTKEEYEQDLLGDSSLVRGTQFAIIHTTTGLLIGDIYLKQDDSLYWIGYTIHPAFARRGYAAESVTAIMAWIAARVGSIIKAGVLPENTTSIKLLEKLRFSFAGKEDGELIYVFDTGG
ncbi:GNAT family N-acetyltransferase [Breznakiella homolactica]|uniref:GNAT family N-acetyltransferase n=1 Tax=Breznakiella homolactica TaxID=2798577 RepID=A0A7T7XK16_9SPIR|nr:GNAT family N-acetyltransferase [Breznakiella homolactica]QQO07603.1 GNAT family N-acetyltransferase [Breznakiella homolactica]